MQTLDFCWLSDIMKGIENIWEEEKVKTKKVLAGITAAAIAASMITGCGAGAKTETAVSTEAETTAAEEKETTAAETVQDTEKSKERILTVSGNGDFGFPSVYTISPKGQGYMTLSYIFDTLMWKDESGLVPYLAEDYSVSEDGMTYTFQLRKGVSFTDGTPFNAEAAKANLDRWADKELGLKRTTLLCNVIGSTEIVDDYTVKVKLSQSFGAFISTLAHPACVLMSPKVIAEGNDACAERPVGTGQYIFKEWIAGDHATVTLNKDWWGYDAEICGGTALAEPDAGFKSVTFRPVAENATRVAMLQSGDADFIWPVPTESMQALAGDTNIYVGAEEGMVVRYLFMNNQKAPFNDKRVRQAVNYAINKDAYIAVVKNGLSSAASSIIGPATQHYKGNDPYPYDPEKAKELLAEAGYPDGFECTLICASTTGNLKQGEFLQQQLAQVGITMNINALESAVVNDKVENVDKPGAEAEVEMYVIGWSSSTGDADWGIRPLVAVESEPPMSYNICYYENEEVDKLLYDALSTADETKRAEFYAQAQDILWEDCPMVCLVNDYNTWATTNKIANVKVYPDNCLNIRNARMAK